MRNKEVLIEGFNKGHFTIQFAYKIAEDGYAFIIKNGLLVDIIRE